MNQKTLRWLKSRRVAVLKGGWSKERPISLKTGAAVEASFRRMGVRFTSIDMRPDVMTILQRNRIQFSFLALHGKYGEDGWIQSVHELMKIPYTGCDAVSSALAMDKEISKRLFNEAGVPCPAGFTIGRNELGSDRLNQRLKKLLSEGKIFVKPFDQGSALGASRVDKFSQAGRALKTCFAISDRALVEKFIEGRELTVGVLGLQALPVIEIIPEHAFYDFHSKYVKGGSRHVIPTDIPAPILTEARRLALEAFDALRCSVYGRVDLLLDKKGKLFVLEVNTIPGMTATSLLPDAAREAGLSFDSLVLRIVELSLHRRAGASR